MPAPRAHAPGSAKAAMSVVPMMRVTHVMAVAKIAVARHRGVAAAAMVKVARLRDRYRQAQCRHQRCGN